MRKSWGDEIGRKLWSQLLPEQRELLEELQRAYDYAQMEEMEAVIEYYNGGPVGLETLAATINEESVTLEDVYEPYLLQIGFLTRTPRGRCVTPKAYQHLGLTIPGGMPPAMEQLTF